MEYDRGFRRARKTVLILARTIAGSAGRVNLGNRGKSGPRDVARISFESLNKTPRLVQATLNGGGFAAPLTLDQVFAASFPRLLCVEFQVQLADRCRRVSRDAQVSSIGSSRSSRAPTRVLIGSTRSRFPGTGSHPSIRYEHSRACAYWYPFHKDDQTIPRC